MFLSTIKNAITLFSRLGLILSLLFVLSCAQADKHFATKDINYNDNAQLLDLYLPKTRDKTTAIMFIHGGGFSAGSKEEMTSYAEQYANMGFVTSSINYRLSLNDSYPAAINDVQDAIIWMVQHADEYGYDANKIVLVGYSAGGTLALNAGLNSPQHVATIIDVAGITDIKALIETSSIPELRTDVAKYMGGKDPAIASPINQINQNSPPVLIFHGDKDDIVPMDQSLALEEKLKNENVPVRLVVFSNKGHGIMLPDKPYRQLLTELTEAFMTIESKKP